MTIPTHLTPLQLDGHACARCGREYGPGSTSQPAGYSDDGRQLFQCSDEWGCSALPSGHQVVAADGMADVDLLTRQADSYAQRVAARIRALIDESGKAVEQIAAETGIKPGKLRDYIDGRKPWQITDIELVCRRSLHINGWSVLVDQAYDEEAVSATPNDSMCDLILWLIRNYDDRVPVSAVIDFVVANRAEPADRQWALLTAECDRIAAGHQGKEVAR